MSGWTLGPNHPDYQYTGPYGVPEWEPKEYRSRRPRTVESAARQTTASVTGAPALPATDAPQTKQRACKRCQTPRVAVYARCQTCYPNRAHKVSRPRAGRCAQEIDAWTERMRQIARGATETAAWTADQWDERLEQIEKESVA